MDELLDVLDLFVDLELEGFVRVVLGIVGVLAIVAGIGLWLLTDTGLLVLPASLMVLGLALLVIPTLLGGLLELG